MKYLIFIIILLFYFPSYAQQVRSNFTLELGLGLSLTHYDNNENPRIGMTLPSLSLGMFFNDNMAVMFRGSSTSYFEGAKQIIFGLYGIHLQVWLSDKFFISGGPGLSLFTKPQPMSGFGFGIRGGYSLVTWEDSSLHISFEFLPGFFKGNRKIFGEALMIEWQWL